MMNVFEYSREMPLLAVFNGRVRVASGYLQDTITLKSSKLNKKIRSMDRKIVCTLGMFPDGVYILSR